MGSRSWTLGTRLCGGLLTKGEARCWGRSGGGEARGMRGRGMSRRGAGGDCRCGRRERSGMKTGAAGNVFAGMATTVIEYSTVRAWLRWFWWPTVVSAGLLAHFLGSVGWWAVWLFLILRDPNMREVVIPSLW